MPAHRIGNAAFLAPEMRTSPDSGTPPLMTQLVHAASALGPVFRRQGLHGQRVDLLAHAIAERPVDQLMALHARLAAKGLAHDHRLEVVAVADHFHVLACRGSSLDVALHSSGATTERSLLQ